jgi:hypothetical protein
MARLAAILGSLAKVVWRDQRSLGSFATNNFFLFGVFLLQKAGGFVYLIVALVLLFPLSADPLRKVPPERLATWPLERWQRRWLKLASPWVNPITWLLLGMAVWAARGVVSVGLLLAAVALVAAGFLIPSHTGTGRSALWRLVPAFPGELGQLIRKDLRQTLSTLDFYCAVILSASGGVYRILDRSAPPDAFMALTILVMLALSSRAQCLFGLDGEGGLTRCALLPLGGWKILAAKDAAFLLIVVLLTAPLAPVSGLAAALTVLAIGHAPSVGRMRSQLRWRFSPGASIGNGFLQVFAMAAAGAASFRVSPLVLAPCLVIYLASVWRYGRALDQRVS